MRFYRIFAPWATFSLAACGLIPIEIPKEDTPAPPPAPLLCTDLQENMTIQVTPLTSTSLEITMTGLRSGEVPVVRVQARTQDGSMDLTETSTKPVDSSGQYTWTIYGLDLFVSSGVPQPPYWIVMVTHAQGVACETVTLPP